MLQQLHRLEHRLSKEVLKKLCTKWPRPAAVTASQLEIDLAKLQAKIRSCTRLFLAHF